MCDPIATRGKNKVMKIAYSAASPYVRKVMACAIARGLNDRIERLKIGTTDPALLAFNPLSKVPTLITDAGMSLYDSPVICQYLDSIGKTDLATLSLEEWATFVECIVTGYCDQLRELAAVDRGRDGATATGVPF